MIGEEVEKMQEINEWMFNVCNTSSTFWWYIWFYFQVKKIIIAGQNIPKSPFLPT